jgi:uncharacterized membrane protein (UPF0136 family)
MQDEAPSPLPTYLATLMRSVLTTLGGWLIGKGYITADQAPEIIGALTVGLTAVWAVIQKRNAHKALQAAIAAPAGQAA